MPPTNPSPSQRRPGKRTNGASSRRWSAHVMATSNALDLEPGIFKSNDPRAIAQSLKRSAEQSTRRKSEPLRSAMSMLNFFVNRAGRNLSRRQRGVLERAKDELRALFGRTVRRSR
jgi:hypothetical protein